MERAGREVGSFFISVEQGEDSLLGENRELSREDDVDTERNSLFLQGKKFVLIEEEVCESVRILHPKPLDADTKPLDAHPKPLDVDTKLLDINFFQVHQHLAPYVTRYSYLCIKNFLPI